MASKLPKDVRDAFDEMADGFPATFGEKGSALRERMWAAMVDSVHGGARDATIGRRCLRAIELAGLKNSKLMTAVPPDEVQRFARVLLSWPGDAGYSIRFHEPGGLVSHTVAAMNPRTARTVAQCVLHQLGVPVETFFEGGVVTLEPPLETTEADSSASPA